MGVVYRATELALERPVALKLIAPEVDGELYLANRFVDGTDLRALLEAGPLPPERALGLVGQVADALDAAHARGLVHRDVKPGNVLVDAADHCYLSDFGLTTQLGAGGTTASGHLAGSLDYLAPEQIRRGTEAQTLWAHMQEEPPALPGHPELEPVLARALAKEQDDRYETCNAFVDDARAALGL